MSSKTFMFLAIAVIASAAIVLLLGQSKQSMDDFGPIFEGFDIEEINDVNTLNLRASSKRRVSMKRDEEGRWHVVEKKNYPADLVKIRKLLVGISEAQRVELKTSRSDQYVKLKLNDPAEIDYQAAFRVDIITSDAERSLFIGDIAEGIEKGQYIRIPGEEESWLVNRRLRVEMDVEDWLDKQIVHIEPGDIHKMSITNLEGETIRIARPAKDGELVLQDIPKGRKPKGGTALSSLATFPDYLTFSDVLSQSNERFKPVEKVIKAVFTTFDGLEVYYTGYRIDNSHYGVFEAKQNNDIAGQFGASDEARLEVEKWVQRLTYRFDLWYYRMRRSLYELLLTDMEKLTDAVEEKK